MSIISRCVKTARSRQLSIVLPEGRDERVVAAARHIKDQGIAEPIVLGTRDEIASAAQTAGATLHGITTIDPARSDQLTKYTLAYCGRRSVSEGAARRIIKRPLYFAGMMVAVGDADTMVAGVTKPTARVVQACALTVGPAAGISRPSSFFLMIVPEFQDEKDKPFIFADCAVNIAPTASELAEIAIASEASARKLLDDVPRVAMLSFSTRGSATHENVEKVTEALEIVRRRAPDLVIDGEFQVDAAIVPSVAAKKVRDESLVAGRANVLTFPDLNSGNIAYKLTQYLAGALAIGPFLQGFAKPVGDLSRGASVDDIVATSAVCLAQA